MLKVRIIPCLDVKNGRVVKGINFVNLVDAGDPVEAAQAYDVAGADELCFLDITASHEKRPILLDVVKKTAEKCFMPLTVGGGVKEINDIKILLESGADKVSINTSAILSPNLIKQGSEAFGSQCIVVAIDAKKTKAGWEIFTHGGREATGIDPIEFSEKAAELGAGEILLTSMDRDGTKKGYDIDLLKEITKNLNLLFLEQKKKITQRGFRINSYPVPAFIRTSLKVGNIESAIRNEYLFPGRKVQFSKPRRLRIPSGPPSATNQSAERSA